MNISLFLQYLSYERNYSRQTIRSYREDLQLFERFLKTLDEEIIWESVDASIIRQWVLSMMNAGEKNSTVNRRLSALRAFYRYYLREGKTDVNPANNVTGPKRVKALPYFIKEKDMDRLLDNDIYFPDGWMGMRDRLIIQTFYMTGMRRGELVGLNDADVRTEEGIIKVYGKGKKERLIPIGEEEAKAIIAYKTMRNAQVPEKKDDAFFVSRQGKRLSAAGVLRVVEKYLSLVSTAKKRSPHVLRHTFATSLLNHHADLRSVQELLGHARLATTEIYTHVSFEELKKIYNEAHPRA